MLRYKDMLRITLSVLFGVAIIIFATDAAICASNNHTDIAFNCIFENTRCTDKPFNDFMLLFGLQGLYSPKNGRGLFNGKFDIMSFGIGYKESRKCATINFNALNLPYIIITSKADSAKHPQYLSFSADMADIKYNGIYSTDIDWFKFGTAYIIPVFAERNGNYLYASFESCIAMRSFRPGTEYFADKAFARNQFGATFSGGPSINVALGFVTLSAYYKASVSTSGACIKSLNPGAELEIDLPVSNNEALDYSIGDSEHINRRSKFTFIAQFDRIELSAGRAVAIANFVKLGIRFPLFFER